MECLHKSVLSKKARGYHLLRCVQHNSDVCGTQLLYIFFSYKTFFYNEHNTTQLLSPALSWADDDIIYIAWRNVSLENKYSRKYAKRKNGWVVKMKLDCWVVVILVYARRRIKKKYIYCAFFKPTHTSNTHISCMVGYMVMVRCCLVWPFIQRAKKNMKKHHVLCLRTCVLDENRKYCKNRYKNSNRLKVVWSVMLSNIV